MSKHGKMKPPEKGKKPKRITTKNKPGHTGPGGKGSPNKKGKKGGFSW